MGRHSDINARTAYLARIAADTASSDAKAAFTELVRLWHPRWTAFARSRAPDLADDALQEAALHMARNIARLRDPARFGGWSMTIIARRVRDLQRRAVRRRRYENDAARETEWDPGQAHSNAVLDADTVLSALSPEQSALVRAYYIEGLSGPELARRFNVPIGTVKSRLHAARKTMRDQLSST